MADVHHVDPGAVQFFLAAAVQRELGERAGTRTTYGAALALLNHLFDRGSGGGLLADSFGTEAMGAEGACIVIP